MHKEFKYEKARLYINGKMLVFPYNIQTAERFMDRIIVLLDIPGENGEVTDNLYAIGMSGDIIWRSQPIKEFVKQKSYLPYEQIRFKDNEIIATDFAARHFYINPKNGRIVKRVVSQW